jgi:hypothetical protein
MIADVLRELQRAGVSSGPLKTWVRCGEHAAKDGCEDCWLQGPEGCADTVIASLVERLVISTRQTDAVLDQRDYWKGVVDRLTAKIVEAESCRPTTQKRRS